MSRPQQIFLTARRLRRFGRLLLASQSATDECLRICLSASARKSHMLLSEDGADHYLFKQFLEVASRQGYLARGCRLHDRTGEPISEFWHQLTSLEQQAFLLLYVEEFDLRATANIMDRSDDDVERLRIGLSQKLSTVEI